MAISDSKHIDASKCYWYVKDKDGNIQLIDEIGRNSITLTIENDCDVFVVYYGETNVESNNLSLIYSSSLVFQLCAIGGGAVLISLSLFFGLKKRKSKEDD